VRSDGAVGRRPTLSLNEWAVLGVIVDSPRHGYDIANELAGSTPTGDVWRVSRPATYRALDRLEALGLARSTHTEPGKSAPPRTVYAPTTKGVGALSAWLETPVPHLRDVRSALLLKLVLIDLLGGNRRRLVDAQRTAFEQQLDALLPVPAGDDPARMWRHHSAVAVAAFLDDL